MDPSDTYQIIILLILLALSAFFSSNETALMSVNKIRLRSLADEGNKRAAMALDILENQTPKLLSAILIGNNIVNISASSLATTLAYSFGGYMVSIVTVILTVLILIFGEIVPKVVCKQNSDRAACLTAYPLAFFIILFYPITFLVGDTGDLHHQSLFKRCDAPDACGSGCSQQGHDRGGASYYRGRQP